MTMEFEMILPPNLVHMVAGYMIQPHLEPTLVVQGLSQYKWDNMNGLILEEWLAMMVVCHLENNANKDDYIPFLKLNDDVQEWVNNNISDVKIKIDIKEKYYDWPLMIVFSNEDEAMLFKLRWL